MSDHELRAELNAAMSTEDRRELWKHLYREERAKLVSPFGNGRLTGQQVAYTKGRVTLRFKTLGL